MDNLGLVPPEPNPFVNTGVPKSGQVWEAAKVPGLYLIVLKYSKYSKTVTYRVKGEYLTPYYEGKEYTLNTSEFLRLARFSH